MSQLESSSISSCLFVIVIISIEERSVWPSKKIKLHLFSIFISISLYSFLSFIFFVKKKFLKEGTQQDTTMQEKSAATYGHNWLARRIYVCTLKIYINIIPHADLVKPVRTPGMFILYWRHGSKNNISLFI